MLKQAEKAALAGLYIVLALGLSSVVLLSARTYSEAQGLASSGGRARVADQYLRMKIRQGDAAGAVSVDDGMLSITEAYPEGTFTDAVYVHDGMLSEQLVAEGVDVVKSMGDPILACRGFQADRSGQGLSYRLGLDGSELSGYILARSGFTEGMP